MSLLPQNIVFTPEEEAALKQVWQEITAEAEAREAHRAVRHRVLHPRSGPYQRAVRDRQSRHPTPST